MPETEDFGLFEQYHVARILRSLLLRRSLWKRRKLFAALGVSVPDAEPEKKQDYEDEEERYI